MPFSKSTITVNGHEVTLDTDYDLQVGALSGDMDKVAAQMGFWGSVWAAAVKERAEAEAHYRYWRAKASEEVLASEPKLAEWKVKLKVEADPRFVTYKQALALADRNVVLAKSAFDSFDKKANQLQSKGAMHRSELDATDMHTPKNPKTSSKKSASVSAPKGKTFQKKAAAKNASDSDDPRVSAMKDIFSKKK